MTNEVSLVAGVVMPIIAIISGMLVAAFPSANSANRIFAANVIIWFIVTMIDAGRGSDIRCVVLDAAAMIAWALAFVTADYKRRTSRT